MKVNLRRCLYECDLSCARCWWLLYGNAEPGPGFPSCPAGSCGIRPDGSGIFYLGWPVPDAPVPSGWLHAVVINYTNYHQKPAEIFVQFTVINNLNSTGIRANIQTTKGTEVSGMYEKSLLCGIMNDWYGRMEDLVADLEGYGFEVLESNREYMDVLVEEDGEVIEVQLFLGGTERTITVEDFEEIRREEA